MPRIKDRKTFAAAGAENGLRGKAFDRALEALGVTVDSAYIAQLVNVYRSHDPTLTLLDDATWALGRLRAAGHRLALLTDGYLEMQQRKVQALSFAPAWMRWFTATHWAVPIGNRARLPMKRC